MDESDEAVLGTQEEAEPEAVVETPEGAGAVMANPEVAEPVMGTPEVAEPVVGAPEGAGAVIGTPEVAGAGASGETSKGVKRGRGNSGGFRRTTQTGQEVQVSDNLPDKERANGRGNQKRKRSDDTSLPPKRIKKCRAVHGVDQKELWCKPCINSKKCVKYI